MVNDLKYWINGQPRSVTSGNPAVKYWIDGQPQQNPSSDTVALTQILNDTLSLSDGLQIRYGLILGDSLTLDDAVLNDKNLVPAPLEESFALNDQLLLVMDLEITLEDTLTLSDFLAIRYGLILEDTLALSDLLKSFRGFKF